MKVAKACQQCREGKRKCVLDRSKTACISCQNRSITNCSLLNRARGASLVPALVQIQPASFAPVELRDDIAQELVENYLIKIHDRPHSLFHPPTLREDVRENRLSRALLFAICSLGSRFSVGQNFRQLETALTVTAKRLLLEDLENICLENIQACILVANLCAAESNPASEALFFRIANSMTEIIRLTSPAPGESLVMLETKRRIWWTLFMADRWCSSGIGLPMRLRGSDKAVELPMSEDIFGSLKAGQSLLPCPWKPGLWAHMVTLVKLFGPIQHLNQRCAEQNLDDEEIESTVHDISLQMQSWEQMLPVDAKFTEENFHDHRERGLGGPFVALHLGFHHYSTLLYFQFLEARRPSTAQTQLYINRCKHHASSYSGLLGLSRAWKNCEAVYPTVGHMAVVSSSVLLHTLLFGEESELPQARSGLNSNFEALIELRQYWSNLASMIDRLVTFQNVCLLSMSAKQRTHELDRWMVRFLIEHALPLEEKPYSFAQAGIAFERETMSVNARWLTEQGRFTDFSVST